MDCVNFNYRAQLTDVDRSRYDAKLSIIGCDPYDSGLPWSDDVVLLPSVTYPDIVNYLIFTPSAYTADDLKAYKSLDAYNQFISGWVRERRSFTCNQHVVVIAKVLHSQRMREKPLRPWIIATKEGSVVGAHCDCMAGLGEACSHIAALLFSIEATIKIRDSKTVTDEKAYWLLPASIKTITYKELREIDFTSSNTSKRKLEEKLECLPGTSSSTPSRHTSKMVPCPVATHADLLDFSSKLGILNSKPAILSLLPPHSDKFVPKADTDNFPLILTELRDETSFNLDFRDLTDLCATKSISCTEQQSLNVEIETRKQSKTKSWYRFRAGRVTASKAKAVCSTNPALPSQSLIKAICYPEICAFESQATKWGCDHEKVARDKVMEVLHPHHDNCKISDTGFVISTDYPYIGASPDGVFTCNCCGISCIEIKCPFCLKDCDLDSCDFLSVDVDGIVTLNKDHAYMYQVQTQMGVSKTEMAYFVAWTESDVHIESIFFDRDMWDEICSKSHHFFYAALLPELVGKFFSTLPKIRENEVGHSVQSASLADAPAKVSCEQHYCYCNQVSHGEMIGCDNPECPVQLFHFRCVKVTSAPKGKWYCPDCRKLPTLKKKRKIKSECYLGLHH